MNRKAQLYAILLLSAVLVPASFAATAQPLVYLDAGGLAPGVVTTWPNLGTLGGFFVNEDKYGTIHDPLVELVAGRQAVTFDGGNNADTDVLQSSFNAPAGITGTAPFSVATLMYNPAVASAEHAISWTERETATAAQSYMALGYGTNTGEGDSIYRRGTDLAYKVAPPAQTWHWVIWTFSGGDPGLASVYVDGVLDNSISLDDMNTMTDQPIIIGGMYWTGHYSPNHVYNGFSGSLAVVAIYDVALTAEEVQEIVTKGIRLSEPQVADNPSPADGASDVLADRVLSWKAGAFARTHDVYLGSSFEDVNAASRANPMDVLVSPGQDANTYDPPARLEFGRTYYWRVDEVNGAPDNTIFRGNIWSFTTEPVSYPLAGAKITATASSINSSATGAEKTIDKSGLTADDQHSTIAETMWLSSSSGPQPAFIEYSFDQTYRLHQMLVWNSNQVMELAMGVGAKDVTVEYSADGVAWTTLGNVVFAQATGEATYTANTTVDFAGAAAKYVKLTIRSNWGGVFMQYGLSEVRFMVIPVQPSQPNPPSGATGIDPQVTLSWRSGREAASHQVLLGTDQQAVADGTASVATVAVASCEPAVELGATYYWKVVEVNEAETPSAWAGDVWSFSTQEFLVIDDFESYTNESPRRVFQAWIDGVGFSADPFFPNGSTGNGTGSMVGYDPAAGNIMETASVHGGRQSMPLAYDNTTAASSETKRTFASPQDWTRHGITGLTLWFSGDPANAAQQMYVKINGTKVPYSGAAEDLQKAEWQPWYVDLSSLSVSSVGSLSIGFDRISAAGGQGKVLIDDIRLYPLNPFAAQPQP